MHGHPPGQRETHGRMRTFGFSGRPRPRTLLATTMALALLAGAAACSSEEDADPPTTTTAASTDPVTTDAPTTTTTEPMSEEDEVAEAYLEAQAVLYEIGTSPDPDDGRLDELYVEPKLGEVIATLAELESEGLVVEYRNDRPPVPEVIELTISGNSARVRVCIVDDAKQIRRATSEVVNDAVVSNLVDVEMTKTHTGWRVSDGQMVDSWRDGRGCGRE